MPSTLLMPVTLVTAAVFGLMLVALGLYVIRGRFKHLIAYGDQGNTDMAIRMRTQANFIEYVPMVLVLMALLEISDANQIILGVAAAVLVVIRIMHAVGMRGGPFMLLRRIGAMGTFLLLIAGSLWALAIAGAALTS